MEAESYKELSKRPGMLMYTGEGTVFRGKEIPSVEKVHFIFNTKQDEKGAHQAVLVDKEFNVLSKQVMLFANLDEFFGLAHYMLRNGMVASN